MSQAVLSEFNGQPAVFLQSPDGARAVVLLHGAQVVSWIPAGGTEQLFLSPVSRYGRDASVRGGVPVIFPQFADRGTGPRHGFARTRAWTLDGALVRGQHAQAVLQLVADDATRRAWPHDFAAELTVSVSGAQLDIELAVTNTGDQPIDFAAALHTYLATGDALKAQLEGLQGVNYQDSTTGEQHQQWGDVVTVVGEIDRVYHGVTRELVLREPGRRLTIAASHFTDAIVWNPGPEKASQMADMPPDGWTRMLCVEAGLVVDPVELLPGDEWSGMQTLILG
jgi:glucose-6-phosphate 1-epimerase